MKEDFVREELVKLYEEYKKFCDRDGPYDQEDSMVGFIKWLVTEF